MLLVYRRFVVGEGFSRYRITPHPALRATFPPRGGGFAVPEGFPQPGEAVAEGD